MDDEALNKLGTLIATEGQNQARAPADVLAWLWEDEPGWKDVNWLDTMMWLKQFNVTLVDLKTATTAQGASVVNKIAAEFLLAVINSGRDLPASDDRVRPLLAASTLPIEARNALVDLARDNKPRWAAVSGREPSLHEIEVAKARSR